MLNRNKTTLARAGTMFGLMFVWGASALAFDRDHDMFVLTSTNSTSGNDLVVFKLTAAAAPSQTTDPTPSRP